jgi:hypothetical protein
MIHGVDPFELAHAHQFVETNDGASVVDQIDPIVIIIIVLFAHVIIIRVLHGVVAVVANKAIGSRQESNVWRHHCGLMTAVGEIFNSTSNGNHEVSSLLFVSVSSSHQKVVAGAAVTIGEDFFCIKQEGDKAESSRLDGGCCN